MQPSGDALNCTDAYLAGLSERLRDPLTDDVAQQAKMCLVDYLACAFLGGSLYSETTGAYLDAVGADAGNAVLVGNGMRVSTHVAATLNGMHAHAAELDDGHRFGMMHVGAPVISALLALAGGGDLDGRRFLHGIVAGYEAAVRLASAIQPSHKLKGFHTTGTCGTIGASMGAAYALGYSGKQLKATLSAASTDAAGLLEIQEDGSQMKPYNAGRAAASAVNAVLVGGAGLDAPADALGGRRGFLQFASDAVDEERLVSGFGDSFAIQKVYRKLYASCRHSHAAIEAALQAQREGGIAAGDIESVEVLTYGLAVAGHDHREVASPASAKMSIPYSVAVALVRGGAGYQQFEPGVLHDGRVQGLCSRVSVAESSELSALVPEKRAAQVRIHTSDGAFAARVDYPKGEPENPISKDELDDKFRSLLAAAGKDRAYAEELLSCAWRVEEDFPALLDMLTRQQHLY